MRLGNLSPAEGANTPARRLGRGIGSGLGKTSGKGHKGQNARSGGGVRPGFEGGNIPMIRKLPMRGFNNKNFTKRYACVNVGDLEAFEANAVIDQELLYQTRFIGKRSEYGLKVLGDGEITKPLTIKAAKVTKQAREKIEKVGGKIEEI